MDTHTAHPILASSSKIMQEASTTSSSEDESPSSAGSEAGPETFQSLDHREEEEELASEDDELSDASSTKESATLDLIAQGRQDTSASKDNAATQSGIGDKERFASNEQPSISPPLPSRPNKYHGPASTWRNWTAPERDLAASLDQLRARNLSVHLYNAFKLKQRASTLLAQQGSRHEEKIMEEARWAPPKVWTAWPLPPDVVPREGEEKHWEDAETPSKPINVKPSKPSEPLRELLVAQVLRQAKERFAAREWEDEVKDATDVQPVTLADDERAMDILRPTIQHVLTKLDGLLMRLHHARSACLPMNEDTDVSESESQGRERSMSKLRGRKRRRDASANKVDFSASSEQSLMSDSDDTRGGRSAPKSRRGVKRPGSYSRNSSRTLHKRKGRLGLRDWGDVLGIASMTCWESRAVEKAATRCSALFEEGISFRTLEEANTKSFAESTHLPDVSTLLVVAKEGKMVSEREVSGLGKKETELFGGVHVDGFLKPIEGKKSWKYGSEAGKRRDRPRKTKG